jgi:hypothetical protein
MAIQLAVPPVGDPVAYLIAELDLAARPSRVEDLDSEIPLRYLLARSR